MYNRSMESQNSIESMRIDLMRQFPFSRWSQLKKKEEGKGKEEEEEEEEEEREEVGSKLSL